MKGKWIKHFAITLCVLVLFGGAVLGVRQLWFNPYRGTVSAFWPSERLETVLSCSKAVEDLDYLVNRLEERHPACINGLPDKVKIEYERERKRITSLPNVSVLSLWQSAARLFASLGDAHTAVGVKYEEAEQLPLSFEWERDTLLCSGNEYNGYAVLQIGGVAVTDLYERFLTQFSYELEAWARHSFASRLNRGEYLSFIGVDTMKEIPLVLKNPNDGALITAAYTLHENITDNDEKAEPAFDYSFDSSVGVAIFILRQCVYNEEFKAGLRDFFTKVQENNIHSVIVDLRGNPGGNSQVSNEFVRYLPTESYLAMTAEARIGPIIWKNKPQRHENKRLEPTYTGDVYVLTGADSFSAAMDFAVLISDNGLGTVVGESPGNMPSSYGDTLYFQTPNAGLTFTVSYKYFIRPDASKRDLPLIPDVAVPAENALTETMRLIGKVREQYAN